MSVHRSRRRSRALLVVAVAALTAAALTATASAAKHQPKLGVPGSKLVPAVDVTRNGKGVVGKTIKIVFNFPLQNCDTGKPGVQPAQEDVATYLTKWFNENVPFPGGRKLALQFVDDGGSDIGCAATARAAGLKTAKEIKAFADIGNSTNRDGNSVYAQTITANGTISIAQAASFQLTSDFTKRYPYAWGIQPAGDASFQPLAWFIGKRVKDTKYVADDGSKSTRKWGGIFFDDNIGHGIAAAAKKYLASVGVKPKLYYVSTDPTQMAQQVTSLAAQIKSDGVNSILLGSNDAVTDITIGKTFTSQNLFPDWYATDFSLLIKLAVFASPLFPGQVQRIHAVGIPDIAASRIDVRPNGADGDSAKVQLNNWRVAADAAYFAAGGQRKFPQLGADLQGIWNALSMLAIGIVNAGPTLNAFTWADGLQRASTCQKQKFFGAYQAQSPLPVFDRKQPWALHGWTTYYWTTAHQSTYSAATGGYLESYDGYFRFLSQKSLPAKAEYDTGEHNGQYPLNPQKGNKVSLDMKCPAQTG